MDIAGRTVLVLGGAGLVGAAVCRELLEHAPARLVVASRRREKAHSGVAALRAEFPDTPSLIVPAWGDVFVRAEWQGEAPLGRGELLADAARRRRLIADVLEPLNEDMIAASLLAQLIEGRAAGQATAAADIVVDCLNTATAVSYQNVYAASARLAALAASDDAGDEWRGEVEQLLASLSVPQLVRHVQLLNEAMRRAGTEAYLKVGTSGSGGMGFNIPYTHGEEKPSRLLLSKSALAGAQTMLTFLMARTPGGPRLVREIKPTACIGWRAIAHGPIGVHGEALLRWDCPPEQSISRHDEGALAPHGDFGEATGAPLEGVYIDTGENGLFSANEFEVITAPGQMQLVTAEDIARDVVRELRGGNSGHDVVAALDGAVKGPSYRGGHLRQAALNRLRQLEHRHGAAVAFECLGPPRLSKLLFEAHLLARRYARVSEALAASPETLADTLEQTLLADADLRQRIVSIGLAILLADGERLLRGPVLKASDPHHGWVDLTAANMSHWQQRLAACRESVRRELGGDASSRHERVFAASLEWREDEAVDVGAVVAWILTREEGGRREKR